MTVMKRLYFFVPLKSIEGSCYISLINKYRLMYLQRGIQWYIYDSNTFGISEAVIYLVGEKHIVAHAEAVNDAVIQKLLSINIAIRQAP